MAHPPAPRVPIRSPIGGLYAVTPDVADTARLGSLVERALAGGARLLQYRNKAAAPALAREQADCLRALTRAHGAILIVNDDAELALACRSDGVHLGRDDFGADAGAPRGDALAALRRQAGPGFLIGVSCYDDLARARAAAAAGADYVAFGAAFASSVKPDATRAELGLYRAAKAELSLPVVAIGGISRENAPQLIAAGVDAVAVISALFHATDIENEARGFQQLFAAHVRH